MGQLIDILILITLIPLFSASEADSCFEGLTHLKLHSRFSLCESKYSQLTTLTNLKTLELALSEDFPRNGVWLPEQMLYLSSMTFLEGLSILGRGPGDNMQHLSALTGLKLLALSQKNLTGKEYCPS